MVDTLTAESKNTSQKVYTAKSNAVLKRNLQLDVLRAIAILMVLGAHLPGNLSNHKTILMIPHNLLETWARCGWAGVDLFFVLSGFLVSGLLFKEHQKYGNVQLGRFLIRRGFKIYPAFYVFLLVTICIRGYVFVTQASSQLSIYNFASEALFVQNYLGWLWPHTWSLAVEEHFYLLLGFGLYLFTLRCRAKANPFSLIPLLFGVVAPAVLIIRSLHMYYNPMGLDEHGASWRIYGVQTHMRFDALLFGVVLSYYWNYHRQRTTDLVRRFRWPIAGVSSTLISTCIFISPWSKFMYTVGFSLLYLGFGGLLMLSMQSEKFFARFYKFLWPLSGIGQYSYSIYLWHYPVLAWSAVLTHHFLHRHLSPGPSTLIYYIGSIAGGILLAKAVEVPSLKLRDRLFPSRSSAI